MSTAIVDAKEAIEIQKDGVITEFPLGVDVLALVELGST